MKRIILKPLMVALLAGVSVAGWAKDVVWNQPSTEVNREIEGYFSPLLEITRVEFAKDETRVFMHIADRPSNWVKISSASYLRADGKRYALKSLDGMQLDTETYLTDHGRVDVVLHFEPLPQKTKRFDFTEGDFQGAWELLGVEQPSTRASQLFPSNWRNTQTGNWDISFYDECAIYDCKFWNYKQKEQKEQKGDTYSIILENGGKEIAVNVEKNKAGKRFITIDGKRGEYDFISSITLPDYPQKDTSTSFKDSGYKTDTVTFVGWLKDMPRMENFEYEVSLYDAVFGGDRDTEVSSKVDAQGRFEMKVPILNTAEAFIDWERTYIRTTLEPGETYFLLYDFKGGHKMFMGKNCRLQNEILAHPIAWVGVRAEERGMEREAALKFFEDAKADKADAMNELQKVIAAHPNISDRYINYLTGSYNACECAALMQGRFSMKNWQVPSEIMDYVNEVGWQQAAKPYTIFREFSTFKRDYIDQLIMDRYNIPVDGGYISLSTTVFPYILKKYKDAGKLQISDEELEIVKRYAEGARKFCSVIDSDEEMRKASDEFYSSELAKQFGAIHEREDVQKIIQDEMPLFDVYKTLSILDSIGCDQDMRDIFVTGELFEILDHERQPLSDFVMNYLEENVKMPAAKAFLKDKQEKYLALSRRDISNSPSLKSPEDVANMSDGEKILRKLIEPYKGKIILMDIWGTWCGPCKEALSHSQQEYERLKEFDLVYLYLANRSPEDAWQNVIKQYDVLGDNVVHYNLPEAQQSAIEKFVKITGYPTFKLIDREGNLLDVNADPRDLEGLARLLKQMQ